MITDYGLVDHGSEHEQYFMGCGVAFTNFTECVTGVGDSQRASVEDALEQMAQNGDILGLDLSEYSDEPLEDNEEIHYFFSIRYNKEAK